MRDGRSWFMLLARRNHDIEHLVCIRDQAPQVGFVKQHSPRPSCTARGLWRPAVAGRPDSWAWGISACSGILTRFDNAISPTSRAFGLGVLRTSFWAAIQVFQDGHVWEQI